MTVVAILFAGAPPARAACTTPTAANGDLFFNSAAGVMQFCNGFNWVQIGSKALGGSGCTSPVAAAGDIKFNSASRVMQHCNGQEWSTWGPVGGTGTYTGSCASPTGAAGDLKFNSDYDILTYCDGATWQQAGPLPASLSMDLVNNNYALRGTSYASLSSFLTAAGGTFSRASTGMYYNSAGTLSTAATNAARFDYDPVTLLPKGLLVEEARSNLYEYSTDFTNAVWHQGAPVGITITANAATAPDGTTTAASFNPTSNGNPFIGGTGPVWTAGQTVTRSLYAKAAGGSVVVFEQRVSNSLSWTFFNLSTGVITPAGGVTASMQNVGNGWYRLVATRTFASASSSSNAFDIIWVDCQCSHGTPGHNVYIWGPQFEVGATPTSYIPNSTAGSVSRAQDTLTMPVGSWFNATTGTLAAQAIIPYLGSGKWPGPASLIGGSNANALDLFIVDTAPYQETTELYNANSQVYSYGGGTYTAGNIFKEAETYSSSNMASAIDGTGDSPASAAIPAFNTLYVGISDGSYPLNGWVQSVSYYPGNIGTGRLRSMTQP